MADLIASGTIQVLVVAFCVGIVVGLTGMGGGALMTPALIFLGVPPTAAVANDLVSAALSKSAGAFVHLRQGSPNLTLVKWLILGSVPMALVGSWITGLLGTSGAQEDILKTVIGATLLLTALTYVTRMYLQFVRNIRGGRPVTETVIRPVPTALIGGLGGLLVGVTSVGSGSLIMVSMLLMYPALSAVKLVGTDLLQAIPLVVAAAIGHIIVSGVDWDVLIPLVIGATPGTMLGARLAAFASQSVVRRGIVLVLSLTGLTMLGVPSVGVGLIGAAMVILGPVAWGVLRHLHGVAPFDHIGPAHDDLPGQARPPEAPRITDD